MRLVGIVDFFPFSFSLALWGPYCILLLCLGVLSIDALFLMNIFAFTHLKISLHYLSWG